MKSEDEIYEGIIRDCYWDYNITVDELKEIVKNGSEREQRRVFEKILLNSTKLFKTLRIYDMDKIKKMIESYKVPNFNHDYIFKRKNIVEAYFFDKPLEVRELRWQI